MSKKANDSAKQPEGGTTDADIIYSLVDANTHVFYNGRYQPLGEAFTSKVSEDPSVQICYHTKHDKPEPGCPWFFTLTRQTDVHWRIEDPFCLSMKIITK